MSISICFIFLYFLLFLRLEFVAAVGVDVGGASGGFVSVVIVFTVVFVIAVGAISVVVSAVVCCCFRLRF